MHPSTQTQSVHQPRPLHPAKTASSGFKPLAQLAILVAVTFSTHRSQAQTILSLPNNFSGIQGQGGVYYEYIGDSRLINTQNRASASISLMNFRPSYSYGYPGDVPLPTYAHPQDFPGVQYDSSHQLLRFEPGTGGFLLGTGTANLGASIRFQVPSTGTFGISGAFARDNTNFNAGDGVDVLVVKGANLDSPLFEEIISSANLVNHSDPFGGTGVADFNFNISLQAGDVLRFIVFSDNQGQDGTFDATAFRVSVSQVPEPTALTLAVMGVVVMSFARGVRRRRSRAGFTLCEIKTIQITKSPALD